ncbi:MAG: hypothetical protein OXG18_04805, partial [Gemmatimonadetes bacterium]|nr:hypothetical protein [Gemmatimonadota bacterium]
NLPFSTASSLQFCVAGNNQDRSFPGADHGASVVLTGRELLALSSPWIISREHRERRSASGPWTGPDEHRDRRSAPLARRDEGPIAAALLVRGATQSAAAQRGCSAARMPWEVCPRAATRSG